MPELSEKEKLIFVFDLAKKFINNLGTILDSGEFQWTFDPKSCSLARNILTLKFTLKEEIIEKEKIKRDKAQRKLDDSYEPEEEELEEIPT